MSDSPKYEKLIDETNPSADVPPTTPGEIDINPRDEEANVNENRLIESNTETKYDEDVALLTEMGFNNSMISKVYIFLRPQSIDQAIQFMTQENGKYQHNFYRQTSSTNSLSNRCFICGEEPRNHHDFVENRSNALLNRIINRKSNASEPISNELNKVSKQDKNDAVIKIGSASCLICLEDIPDEDMEYDCLKCKHIFCHSCWYEYLNEKIGNSKVSKLTCMQHGCKELLSEDFILHNIQESPDLIKKYNRFKKKLEVLEDPNKKFCPQPNCDGIAERIDEKDKYVTCDQGHKFCFVCLKDWHGKKKCQNEIDKDFQLWKKDKIVKQCPKCKFWIEKNKGCNHITCAECGYQWCWLCRGQYSSTHFEAGGGCAGLQFSDSNCFQNCFCLYGYKLVVFITFLFLYWIIPLFIASIAFTVMVLDHVYDVPCLTFLIGVLMALAYSCAYEIFVSSLMTLSVIPIFFYPPLLGKIIDCFWDFLEDMARY